MLGLWRIFIILNIDKVTITIGYGSPKKGNLYSVHGSALDAKEVDATRKNLGWPFEPFYVPKDVNKHWSRHVPDGAALETEWNAKFADYEKKYKEEAAELKSISSGELPAGWEKALLSPGKRSPRWRKGSLCGVFRHSSHGDDNLQALLAKRRAFGLYIFMSNEFRTSSNALRSVAIAVRSF
ncbi:hypothetical protein RHSIM_Rhsim04G0189800 [Rhododendron simsii]|uniref:Transketolase N-terminal domain-containing protein n=1 Tax=Rhododendron simsii TaxID=118357 RepID=A0A834H004_RHOSS|nr:hypothetical protein RHSIM_Rhsim04G0189800 [Rhododendron simsii]